MSGHQLPRKKATAALVDAAGLRDKVMTFD
jgi:hypothetical protein